MSRVRDVIDLDFIARTSHEPQCRVMGFLWLPGLWDRLADSRLPVGDTARAAAEIVYASLIETHSLDETEVTDIKVHGKLLGKACYWSFDTGCHIIATLAEVDTAEAHAQ